MSISEVINRIFQMIFLLFGISFIVFCLMYLAPGDPVLAMYALNGGVPSEEIIQATRQELGLNDPFFLQYFNWLKNCLSGDLGMSFYYNKPVMTVISHRIFPTLKLAFLSLTLVVIISLPLGFITAIKQNQFTDYFLRFISFIGISLPNFWVGLILIYIFSIKLGLFPVVSNGTGFNQIILPAITLSFSMCGKYIRQIRIIILEELNQNYVVGARARGIKESEIWIKEVLPNILIPLITLLGVSFGSLLGGTAIVEVIFSYPGLGNMAVLAVSSRDYLLIQGYVLFTAIIYMIFNFLVDISYAFFDPKIKRRQ